MPQNTAFQPHQHTPPSRVRSGVSARFGDVGWKHLTVKERVNCIAASKGVVTAGDLEEAGLPRQYLQRLYEYGVLERVGRGMYVHPAARLTEDHAVVEAACRVPRGVACLLTALRLHGVMARHPSEVWLAVERGSWVPTPGSNPIRIAYMSGVAFEEGIEERRLEGVPVRVFSTPKTVADCFKFRDRVGIGLAVRALCAYRRRPDYDADSLHHFARICRVRTVIRPYLDALG